MEYPRGASVISVVHFHTCLSLKLGQTIFVVFDSHTNPNSNMVYLESDKVRRIKLLSYYNTIYGKGVQMFKWGFLTRNLNLDYYIKLGIIQII